MSIDKFFAFFGAYKRFFKLNERLEEGFWVMELIVAMAILTVLMLVLARFGCNMIVLEGDSMRRIEAIDCLISVIEVEIKKGKIPEIYEKKGEFKVDCRILPVHEVKNSFPERIKSDLSRGLADFRWKDYRISFASGFGNDQIVRISTGYGGGSN